jgi:hypothetical protein
MTEQRRIVLIGVGVAAAAVLIALVLVVVNSGGSPRRVATKALNRSTTTALPVTTADPRLPTTVDLLPVPASPVTAGAVPHVAVPTTLPPPTTTTAAPPPTETGQGALLTPPATPDRRSGSPDNCTTFADPGGWTATCGVVHTTGGDLLWMVESQPVGAATAWRAYVLRQVTTSRWDVALVAKDDAGTTFTAISVAVADVVGDGGREAVFGFHSQRPPNLLSIDVVQPPGRVGLHQVYPNGSVVPSTAAIGSWWSNPGETDYGHQVLRYLSGTWRIVLSERVPPPPPQSAV